MNPVEAAVFGVLSLGVLYWMYYEYQRYATQELDAANPLPYSRKRFRRRTLVSLLFLLILTMLAFREPLTRRLSNHYLVLLYYLFPLLAIFYIMLLALADLVETSRQIRLARDELTRESAEKISRELLRSGKLHELMQQQPRRPDDGADDKK